MSWSGGGAMNYVLQPKFKKAMAQSSAEYNKGIKDIETGYGAASGYWQPWYDSGKSWLGEFNKWRADPNAVTSDPSYQFRLNQGIGAIENSAAARGGLLSGNTLRGVTDYAQNAASQEYNNQFARWLQQLGLGQNATNAMSGIATGKANAKAGMRAQKGQNAFNQTLASAAEIRQAELGLNSILQSWMPSSFGGGGGGGGGGSPSTSMNPDGATWMGG